MRGFIEAKAHRKWMEQNTPLERARRDQCPDVACTGELDTGFECFECGKDALPILEQGDTK
jgi:hypothetical protein